MIGDHNSRDVSFYSAAPSRDEALAVPHHLRTAGAAITIKMSTVATINPRLIGRVTNTEGSPRDTCSVRRKFSSTIGPSTNPSIIGTGLQSSILQTMPRMPKIAMR